MKNVQIADKAVEFMRGKIPPAGEFIISVEEAMDVLICLERLATVERHLTNLVSLAYEGK